MRKYNTCAECGKLFFAGGTQKKYCSKQCRSKVERRRGSNTLCWDCVNYKCSWMQRLEPIKGWEAEKTFEAYKVIDCPEYIQGREE